MRPRAQWLKELHRRQRRHHHQHRIASTIETRLAAPKIATKSRSFCVAARPQASAASAERATNSRKRGSIYRGLFQDKHPPRPGNFYHRHLSLPQSSFSSCFTSGAIHFFILSQSGERRFPSIVVCTQRYTGGRGVCASCKLLITTAETPRTIGGFRHSSRNQLSRRVVS